jgi:ankyrin repeat protein
MRDRNKRTPLFYAIYYNNYEMVNFLLNNGAETLFSDEKQRTILHYACIFGVSKGIIQLILDFNDRLD